MPEPLEYLADTGPIGPCQRRETRLGGIDLPVLAPDIR